MLRFEAIVVESWSLNDVDNGFVLQRLLVKNSICFSFAYFVGNKASTFGVVDDLPVAAAELSVRHAVEDEVDAGVGVCYQHHKDVDPERRLVVPVDHHRDGVRRPANAEYDEDNRQRLRQTHRRCTLEIPRRRLVRRSFDAAISHALLAHAHIAVDLEVTVRDEADGEADAGRREEDRVAVVGGAVPHAVERLLVVVVVAPAHEVGHFHQRADDPQSHCHQYAVAQCEDLVVARVVANVHVAVEAESIGSAQRLIGQCV